MKKVTRQWLWLVAIWGASVMSLATLGYLIKWVLA
jgi:hypothetical protein